MDIALNLSCWYVGDKDVTTVFGKLNGDVPCSCMGPDCPCAQGQIKILPLENRTMPIDPNNPPKNVSIVRSGVWGPERINKCKLNDNCTRALEFEKFGRVFTRGLPVVSDFYWHSQEEVLPNNQIRARLRKARPVSDQPKKLIKPMSYVSPVYDPPQVRQPAAPAAKPMLAPVIESPK